MEEILFIINPLCEKRLPDDLNSLLEKYLDTNKFKPRVLYTEYPGHACEIVEKNKDKIKHIVAVGGDGTVNEVSKNITNSKNFIGILPVGSGNGLARAMKIPMYIPKAIKLLNKGRVIKVDTGLINGKHFINMAGIGFDAEIAHASQSYVKRGFWSYTKNTIQQIKNYAPDNYTIEINNNSFTSEAFLISIANSSQYGNNVHISPKAKVNDGLLDLCIVRKFPLWKFPFLAGRLFLKSFDKSKYNDIVHIEKCQINIGKDCFGHVDGEPVIFNDNIEIQVQKQSIQIIGNI